MCVCVDVQVSASVLIDMCVECICMYEFHLPLPSAMPVYSQRDDAMPERVIDDEKDSMHVVASR